MDATHLPRAPASIEDRTTLAPMGQDEALQRRFNAQQAPLMGWASQLPPALAPYNRLQDDAGAADIPGPQAGRIASSQLLEPAARLSQMTDARAPVSGAPPGRGDLVDMTPEEQGRLSAVTIDGWRDHARSLLRRGLISESQYLEILSRIPRGRGP